MTTHLQPIADQPTTLIYSGSVVENPNPAIVRVWKMWFYHYGRIVVNTEGAISDRVFDQAERLGVNVESCEAPETQGKNYMETMRHLTAYYRDLVNKAERVFIFGSGSGSRYVEWYAKRCGKSLVTYK